MEIEEQNAQTPRSGKKKGVSKASAAIRKIISRRVNRSISSERGGSASSLENVPTEAPSTKRLGSLGRRFSRGRNKSDVSNRGAVTERAPRRSFSVDDMANIDDDEASQEETDSPVVPIEKEMKVPDFGDSEQFAKPIFYANEGSGLVPPDTPVHEQRQNPRDVRTRSSSSANISGNDELHEAEAKETVFEDVADHVRDAAMHAKESEIEEKVKEIDALRDSSFDYTADADADADATIDAQIERTVMESLVSSETASKEVTSIENEKNVEPARETVTDKEKKLIVEEETEIEMIPPESTEVVEVVAAEITEKDAEAFLEAMEDIGVAQVVSRDMDITDQVVEDEKEDHAVTDEAGETDEPEASITKPKRRRKFKIIRRASISLAYLAVGLLIVIIKNKH